MEGYISEIRGFAGDFAPRGWAICAGQIITISSNTALFSLIGTYYGGDGRSTFGLPDLRSKVPVGAGQSPGHYARPLGSSGGVEQVTLAIAQMPMHNHIAATSGGAATISGGITATMKVNDDEPETLNPSGQFLSKPTTDIYAGTATTATLNTDAIEVDASGLSVTVSGISVQVQNAGGVTPVSLMQPYQAINWIICVTGIFPSRN